MSVTKVVNWSQLKDELFERSSTSLVGTRLRSFASFGKHRLSESIELILNVFWARPIIWWSSRRWPCWLLDCVMGLRPPSKLNIPLPSSLPLGLLVSSRVPRAPLARRLAQPVADHMGSTLGLLEKAATMGVGKTGDPWFLHHPPFRPTIRVNT